MSIPVASWPGLFGLEPCAGDASKGGRGGQEILRALLLSETSSHALFRGIHKLLRRAPNLPQARFLSGSGDNPKGCQRGSMENHIKSWKTHLAADRTSCSKAAANQFRLFLHAGAYWLMWALRNAMPKRSAWRVLQFDTLRLRLVKIAVRVEEMKTQVRLHLPSAYPHQAILRTLLGSLPRFVT